LTVEEADISAIAKRREVIVSIYPFSPQDGGEGDEPARGVPVPKRLDGDRGFGQSLGLAQQFPTG
jgi:hypothetical protein